MADKTTQDKEIESTEEVEKSKTEETTPTKEESEDSTKNGESEEKENGKEDEEETTAEAEADDTDKVCSVKRKSTGGDAASEAPTEGVTPEKKAKLAETAEAESNGEAEVAA